LTTTTKKRLIAFVLFVLAIAIAVRSSNLTEIFTPESIREQIQLAGLTGLVCFALAFTLGLLAYLPGTLFIAAAVYVYGWVGGGALALGAGIIAVSLNFLIARSIAGTVLGASKNRVIQRLCDGIDDHPLRNVILLRLIFNAAPILNHALAMSPVRFREYIVGSALGMTIPMFTISGILHMLL